MTRISEDDMKKFTFDVAKASNGGKQETLDEFIPKLHADLQELKDRFASDAGNSDIIEAAEDVVHALESVSESGDSDGITDAERMDTFQPAWQHYKELNVNPVAPADLEAANGKIDGFLDRLRGSALGAELLDSVRAGGGDDDAHRGMPEIKVAPLNQGNPGAYDDETHVLTLNATMVNENPDKVLMTLAHELTHTKQVQEGTYGEDSARDEDDARAFAADVARELDLDPALAEGGAAPAGAPPK